MYGGVSTSVRDPVFMSVASARSHSYGIARLESKCERSANKLLTSFGLVAIRATRRVINFTKSEVKYYDNLRTRSTVNYFSFSLTWAKSGLRMATCTYMLYCLHKLLHPRTAKAYLRDLEIQFRSTLPISTTSPSPKLLRQNYIREASRR